MTFPSSKLRGRGALAYPPRASSPKARPARRAYDPSVKKDRLALLVLSVILCATGVALKSTAAWAADVLFLAALGTLFYLIFVRIAPPPR